MKVPSKFSSGWFVHSTGGFFGIFTVVLTAFLLIPKAGFGQDAEAVLPDREVTRPAGADTAEQKHSHSASSVDSKSRVLFKKYLAELYAPSFLLQASFSAMGKHIRQSPQQWGGGSIGLKRRVGHSYTRRFVEKSIGHSVAAALGEVDGYQRSKEKRFWSRFRHAIVSTFVTGRAGGGKGLAYSRLAGTTGSFLVANTWYARGANGVSDALRYSGLSLCVDAVTTVFKEFWPDLKSKISRRKRPDPSSQADPS